MPHEGDPRQFTITGGLPFHGQFSSTGCLPAMVEKLRNDRAAFGLITGNGGYAQKHSAGLYSAQKPKQVFKLPDVEELQAKVNTKPKVEVTEKPEGRGKIEAYTVHHNQKNEPFRGVVMGRLLEGSGVRKRFIANVENNPTVFKRMTETECLNATGRVFPGGPKQPNRFVFDD